MIDVRPMGFAMAIDSTETFVEGVGLGASAIGDGYGLGILLS